MGKIENMQNSLELQAQQEKIKTYIEANRVDDLSLEGACGDGRPPVEGSISGRVRKFGADFGDLMAIKAALNVEGIEISSSDLVFKYLAAVKKIRGQDSKISVHTDTNNQPLAGIGCGHIGKSIVLGMQQNLSPEELQDLYEAVLASEHEITVLNGEHKEEAVLLIHGKDHSIKSSDDNGMYFVVDVDRALDFIGKVAPLLNINGLNAQNVKDQWVSQMDKTARVLATGKNMFDVNFDQNGESQILFSGVIPSLS